ncbi:hypothetical protein ACWEFD_33745 [Streptomyces ardesiacus]
MLCRKDDNVAVGTIYGALADEIEVMNRARAAFYDLMVKHNTDLISAGFFGSAPPPETSKES